MKTPMMIASISTVAVSSIFFWLCQGMNGMLGILNKPFFIVAVVASEKRRLDKLLTALLFWWTSILVRDLGLVVFGFLVYINGSGDSDEVCGDGTERQ